MEEVIKDDVVGIKGHWEYFTQEVVQLAPQFLSSFVSAVIIYFLGSYLIKIVRKLLMKYFEAKNLDITVLTFLSGIIKWTLKILLFVIVITQLGVQTSAFIALLGGAALAIGMSLQGSLSNFAGGILIIVFKPFKIGDYISTSNGVEGTVLEIGIFNTKLRTVQNLYVSAPNGNLSNSNVINYTELGVRITRFTIGVSYDADLKKTKNILLEVINNNKLARKDPKPEVVVTELGDSAVNLSVRVAASTDDYWAMHEQLIIDCKNALDKEGISIPFPQRDVHLYQA